MKIQFNEAQLSRPQKESLVEVLNALQAQNKNELEVTAVEFPIKLLVKLDNDFGLLLGWDVEQNLYVGLTESESPNKPKVGAIKSFELPESKKDTVDLPESEWELTPVLEGVKTLARELVANIKAMDNEQRQVFWSEFSSAVTKELL